MELNLEVVKNMSDEEIVEIIEKAMDDSDIEYDENSKDVIFSGLPKQFNNDSKTL